MSAPPLGSIRTALETRPVLVFLAGPNGAGKTTFFDEYLERLGLPFVNADRVAAVLRASRPTTPPDPHAAQPLAPPDPRAARPTAPPDLPSARPVPSADEIDRLAFTQAEELRRALLDARLSFCTETVFSDPAGAKLGFLGDARARGFATFLIFIGLESAALSVGRVFQRVQQGGHDVPDEKLHARFPRTLANLRAAIPLVDEAFVFDNSSADAPYRIVAVYHAGRLATRHPPLPRWTRGLPGLWAGSGRPTRV